MDLFYAILIQKESEARGYCPQEKMREIRGAQKKPVRENQDKRNKNRGIPGT